MKRVYEAVAIAPREGGHALLLDGKPTRTPAGRPFAAPTAALAARIAEEWRGQGARIRPAEMPLTQLLNTALDRMADAAIRAEAIREVCGYAATDLVCFRAADPPELARRQAAAWQPLVDWMAARYRAPLRVTTELRAPEQSPEALARIAAAVAGCDDFRLAALHVATGLLGSVVLALALAEGRIDAEAAYRAAHIDDLHQIETWGEDAEAMARLAGIRADIAAAAEFLALLRA
jgi:chaperone required for assembly of F1-ATPase